MKRENLQATLLIGLTIVYHFFFWGEKLGLNLLLFSSLLTGVMLYLYPAARRSPYVWASAALTFIAGAMVVWHNSFIAQFAHIASLMVMVGFVFASQHKVALYALGTAISAFALRLFYGIPMFIGYLYNNTLGRNKTNTFRLGHGIRLVFLPIVISFIFFLIFYTANGVFASYVDQAVEQLSTFLISLSIEWLFFIGIGFFLLSIVVVKHASQRIGNWEARQQDQLLRIRRRIPYPNFKTLDLLLEYRIGLLLMLMVNVLLLVVNLIDIRFLWFNFDSGQIDSLSQMVHQGTFMLILSILLSMAIMLYYFRRNLNFLQAAKWLRIAAIIWIAQNGILIISVALRVFYYVGERGLAYKRIGVLIFLALTLFGLLTLAAKITNRKTTYYLIRLNSWVAYIMMIAMACVNWDMLIVKYNLLNNKAAPGEYYDQFTLSRSDQALQLIDTYSHEVMWEAYVSPGLLDFNTDYREISEGTYAHYFGERVQRFKTKYEKRSWLSWNYSDWSTYQYFVKQQN